MLKRIRRYFFVDERGSSPQTEILAGSALFLSLSYVFIVNPAILERAGGRIETIAFATAITSGVATIVLGLWARLPFALAPGMEMNAYLAFAISSDPTLTWADGMGAVFWSGLAFVALSASGLREQLLRAIPSWLTLGLSLAVGVFIGLIALRVAGVLPASGFPASLATLATTAWLPLVGGFGLILVFDRYRVKAAVLISIIAVASLMNLSGLNGTALASPSVPEGLRTDWPSFGAIMNPKIVGLAFVLFVIDFFGSVAKLVGLSTNTSILKDGRVPRLKEALLVDSVGTTAGGLLGTSNLTVYVESGVAISAGGRTGIVAVVCGLLMLLVGWFSAPLVRLVPAAATTGALLWVTYSLIPTPHQLATLTSSHILAIVVIQIVVVATGALDKGLLVGMLWAVVESYLLRRETNAVLLVSSIAIATMWLLQELR